jgi:F-type H+-transporting ATPase subunit epsilon
MSETQETGGLLRLEILTPGKRVAELDVPMVTMPGIEGYFGVLPGHMPLITKLMPGVITFEEGGMPRRVAVSSAIVEVIPERVIVLARTAEFSATINMERAQRALTEAEKRVASLAPGAEGLEDAENEAHRAQARIQAMEEGE